jgi:dTMP kinase
VGRPEVTRRGVRGKFITLEGGEGVGKSTQAARLAEALRARGLTVVVTREPGGTAGAEAIRDLLMTGTQDKWSARAEAFLFAAARTDHVEKLIQPALARGDWVICDRFVDSTRAYQGGAAGLIDDDILALHRVGSGGLMPDRTLLLILPYTEAGKRAEARESGNADRFGARNDAYHARLLAAFERLAAEEPARFRKIDASGDAAIVTARLLGALKDVL